MDRDDHVREPPEVIDCSGDGTAVENAVQLLDRRMIEVWDRSRRVIRLEPEREWGGNPIAGGSWKLRVWRK
jgi:hypothetical protein